MVSGRNTQGYLVCQVLASSGKIPIFRLGISMKTYMCVICGYVYKEAEGSPDEGIAPGTRWEDVPMNWHCPECGAGKEDFEMMEI
jgi:rubredoxin